MLSINELISVGVDVSSGLHRCMDNESFYLRLVGMALDDGGFDKLRDAVRAGDKQAAFEAAHALKGVLGNLSLTPLYEPVSKVTELLRAKQDADYDELIAEILQKREELLKLREA